MPTCNPAHDLQYMSLEGYQGAKGRADVPTEYLTDYAPDGSHELPVPSKGAAAAGLGGSASGPTRSWVDQAIQNLIQTRPDLMGDALTALKCRPLAEKWNGIDDPTLKQEALEDIKARWKAQGWWDNPPKGAARKTKPIYERGA